MKRKLAVIPAAFVAALAVTAVALAASNHYSVIGSITPALKTKANPRHPVPVSFGFNFQVTGPNSGPPNVIRTYSINAYGVRSVNAHYFPKCTNFDNSRDDNFCRPSAIVGTGTIINRVYNPSNPTGGGFSCRKSLRIYNSGPGKLTLFLYGPASECGGIGAPFVIPATFKKSQGGGTSLNFTVPYQYRHQLGLNIAVTSTQSTIRRLTARVRAGSRKVRRGRRTVRVRVFRTVGFFEKVNCHSRRTPISVRFTDESNQTTTASYNGQACS